ncbi:hypothetical protein SDC9_81381 [bioreactor metagenome]|uniref:Uncharacterized protein n=1 Tax=bioreactor metagenome TaxID=1076179 RepID=A0A644ZA88_9ZZZZ
MACNFLLFSYGLDEFFGEILGMGAFKADPANGSGGKGTQMFEELREIDDFPLILIVITIHILPKQSHFLNALGVKECHLLENIIQGSGNFPSSHIRDDAIGTKIVASIHDGNVRTELPFLVVGGSKGVRLGVFIHLAIYTGKNIYDALLVIGPDDIVYLGSFILEIFLQTLSHTPSDDEGKFSMRFDMSEISKPPPDTVVCTLAHRTGIEYGAICLVSLGSRNKSCTFELQFQCVAFGNVHLATVGFQPVRVNH